MAIHIRHAQPSVNSLGCNQCARALCRHQRLLDLRPLRQPHHPGYLEPAFYQYRGRGRLPACQFGFPAGEHLGQSQRRQQQPVGGHQSGARRRQLRCLGRRAQRRREPVPLRRGGAHLRGGQHSHPRHEVMTGYLYDASGTRVAKGSITAWSCDPAANGFTTINDYVLGLGGEQVTEMGMGSATTGSTTSGLAWQHTNVWAGGKLLGTYDNDGLHFYFDDPLGTRRVQTDYAGVVEQTCQSLPYGDGETCLPTPTEHLFTGKERDIESGNDYFGARYYASSMGRFMSPDWAAQEEPVPYAQLDDPQSLNLYSYVRNNPMTRFDPDGHACAANDSLCQALAKAWDTIHDILHPKTLDLPTPAPPKVDRKAWVQSMKSYKPVNGGETV